ncbi:MAG: hypothetical protein QHH17_06905 [Candidatus Bathyarchaeota archaeon]|jgi:hypothetical protein|nr:hypothetical protein [Candidatus Bathyarchaeota archaeon]
MPIPRVLVTRYFQLLVNRQFAEAERELEKIKQKMHKTEWNRGYFRGLYGMMLARRSNNNDSYAFFSKLDLNDKGALHSYRREFLSHVQNRLHGDFDRGFFSAWADCMHVLSRMNFTNNPHVNNTVSERGRLETLKDDERQATMENFLGKKPK